MSAYSIVPPWDDIIRRLEQSEPGFNFHDTRLLDLGYSGMLLRSLFGVYERMRFKRYQGGSPDAEECYGYPLSYHRYQDAREELPSLPSLTPEEVEDTFVLQQSTAQEFLATCREGFDLIVISNLLHLNEVKEDWRFIVQSSIEHLGPNGVIYVKVFQHDIGHGYLADSELHELGEMIQAKPETLSSHPESAVVLGRY